MSVPHISLTLSVTWFRRASSLGYARRDGARANRSLPSPGARGEGSSEPRQRAVAPIFCDSLRRESRTLRFPGGYDRPNQHPDKGLSDRGDGRSQAMAFAWLTPRRRAPRSRHSVSLATETFVSRATTSKGSPRNKRATTAILRWTE